MDKIFEQAKDLHVKAVVAYGKAADSKLYANSDYDAYLDADVVEDAFAKGLLVIKVGTSAFVPVAFGSDKYLTIDLTGSPAALAGTQWTVATEA